MRAPIGYSKSGYPVLFTDSPLAPPNGRRQTRVSYEQNGFPVYSFIAVTDKVISQKIKLFPKYTKKVTKVGLEALTGKALSV